MLNETETLCNDGVDKRWNDQNTIIKNGKVAQTPKRTNFGSGT